jgi:hypothetical protein
MRYPRTPQRGIPTFRNLENKKPAVAQASAGLNF